MFQVGDKPVPGYRLIRFLGEGQFGEVWEAQGPGGILVALKLINLDSHKGWTDFKGIFRVRDIRNPFLVAITGIWVLDDEGRVLDDESIDDLIEQATASSFIGPGRKTVELPTNKPNLLVIGMELCEKSLYDLLKETNGRGVERENLLEYMRDAARGLDYLNRPMHRPILSSGRLRGTDELVSVRHCDVKPDNIMIVGGGAKICDFGLAQIADATGAIRKSSDKLQGTVPYMAPEVINGDGPSQTTDQYALAITYYELRTGDIPFGDDDKKSVAAVLDAHRYGRLDLARLPEAERKIIRKATAVKPKNRFRSSGELVEALKLERKASRWGRAAALAMMLTLGVLAAVAFLYWPEPAPSVPPEELAQAGKFAEAWKAVRLLPEQERGAPSQTVLELHRTHVEELIVRDLTTLTDDDRASLNHQEDAALVLATVLGWSAEAATAEGSSNALEPLPDDVGTELATLHWQLLADMVDDAATLIDTVSAGDRNPQGRMLQQLVQDARASHGRRSSDASARAVWEAEFLLARFHARNPDARGLSERLFPGQALAQRLATLREGANASASLSVDDRRLLLLDALLFVFGPQDDLSMSIDELARLQPRVESRIQLEKSTNVAEGAIPQAWAWTGSWEELQWQTAKKATYDKLVRNTAWWEELTPETRRSVTRLWPELAVPEDASLRLVREAEDARKELLAQTGQVETGPNAGALATIEAKIAEARAEVRQAEAENEKAYAREIDVEELCLWLSYPDHYQSQLSNPDNQKSLASATLEFPLWLDAAAKLANEGNSNPLADSCRVESQLQLFGSDEESSSDHLPTLVQTAENAHRLAMEGPLWRRSYATFVLGAVLHEQEQFQRAGRHVLEALDPANQDDLGAALLALDARRQRAATILLDATRQWTDDTLATNEAVSLGKLFSVSTDEIQTPVRMLDTAKGLAVNDSTVFELQDLIVSFVKLRHVTGERSAEWQELAQLSERLLVSNSLETSYNIWIGPVHAIAADSLRQGSSGGAAPAEIRRRIVEHYVAAVGDDFSAIRSRESDSLVAFYENVVEPAVEIAESLDNVSEDGSPEIDAGDPLAPHLAAIFRTQGLLIKDSGYAIHDHLRERDSTIDQNELALSALLRANALGPTARSLLVEGYTRHDQGEPLAELIGNLNDLAQRAKPIAKSSEDQSSAHYLNGYALLHEARLAQASGAGSKFLDAIGEFEEAIAIIRRLQQEDTRGDRETDLARFLTGVSTARVEYCVAAKPPRDVWRDHLHKAEASLREIAEANRQQQGQHEAWIAWGNVLEDLAFYCDQAANDKVAHYADAISKFQRAAASSFRGSLAHAKATMSLARCRVRSVESGAVSPTTTPDEQLRLAEGELRAAIESYDAMRKSSESQRQRAEALFWLGKATILSAGNASAPSVVEQYEQYWRQAADDVRETQLSNWADYQLELAKHAWSRGDRPKALEFSMELVTKAVGDPAAAAVLSNRQVNDSVSLAIASQANHLDEAFTEAVAAATGGLPTIDRTTVLAQSSVYGLSWMMNQGGLEEAAYQRFQSDFNSAESLLEELRQREAAANGSSDIALKIAEARAATAQGACAFVRALFALQQRKSPDWSAAQGKLDEAWKSLRAISDDAAESGVAGSVAIAVNDELELLAKTFLVQTNKYLLADAVSNKDREQWTNLDRQVVQMLNVREPDEKLLRDGWTEHTRTFPRPAPPPE